MSEDEFNSFIKTMRIISGTLFVLLVGGLFITLLLTV